MKKIFCRFLKFCGRKWVKWSFIAFVLIVVTAAHFVMSAKYGDTEMAPSQEFTMMLHSALLLMVMLVIIFYKKFIKQKLMEYGKDNGNKND